MRRAGMYVVMAAALALLLATESGAQPGYRYGGSGGSGTGGHYGGLYDPKTVETLNGEVVSVAKMTPMKGKSYGIHLMLRTHKETIPVHLGPGWFIESQDVKIELKDRIDVKGSRITYEGKPAIIAAEVRKGDAVLMLRDGTGLPVWGGSRQR